MTIKGFFQLPDNTPLAPKPELNMLAATLGVTLAQAAAFNILRPARYSSNDANQFSELRNLSDYNPDTPDKKSALGTPIFGTIMLGTGVDGGRNDFTDAQGKSGFYNTVELDCALVTIGFDPKVVKTDIQGLPYSITEFISSGDNSVTIEGIYTSTPDVAPIDFITNMSKIFSVPVPIPVTNYYLNANNINYIKIMPGTSMWQEKAGYAYQRFTITALSDVPMTEMFP